MSITALPIPQWEEDIPDSEVLKSSIPFMKVAHMLSSARAGENE